MMIFDINVNEVKKGQVAQVAVLKAGYFWVEGAKPFTLICGRSCGQDNQFTCGEEE